MKAAVFHSPGTMTNLATDDMAAYRMGEMQKPITE